MAMAASAPAIHEISKCFVEAKTIPEEAKEPIYLTNWDLSVLSGNYIQTGLLFSKPKPQPPSDDDDNRKNPESVMTTILDTLKDSLSRVLVHFYPLVGRLKTHKDDSPSYYIYIDCSEPQGAEFVHAYVDLTLDDILSPIDVPEIVRSFFLYSGSVNHDGHTLPLLGIQVTELVDGYFIGCSFCHVVGDGTSFWHFFNSWSEIAKSKGTSSDDGSISNPPILKRWFLQGQSPIINLPYSAPEEFIDRFTPKPFRERVFHFSSKSMAQLKSKANQDCNTDKISSFQSLCSLVWRSVYRVRGVPAEETARCFITMGDRARLEPPISKHYLGNCVGTAMCCAPVGELLGRGLGHGALICNESINSHNNNTVRKKVEDWVRAPKIQPMARIMDGRFLVIGLSRFDAYGNDFGWGKPLAIRRGIATKFDGRISAYPGAEGGSSIDLVCCLAPETMAALELDEEFMSFVSPTTTETTTM